MKHLLTSKQEISKQNLKENRQIEKIFYNNEKILILEYIKCFYKLTRNKLAKGTVSSQRKKWKNFTSIKFEKMGKLTNE